MRFRASTAGLGLTLLCGSMMYAGCASSDNGGDGRNGGATSKGGSTSNAGTGGSTGGSGGQTTSKGGSGGSGGGTATVCSKAEAISGELISDFEAEAATFMTDELNGGYYAYGDPMGGTTVPDTSTPPTMLEPEAGDHDGNALHYSGSGFPSSSWGAGFGIWLRPVSDGTACADASGVDGISFWAKNDRPLRVGATIPGTQAVADGGECAAASCMPNSFTVEPNADWTLIEIPWEDFTGGTAPFSPDAVLGIDILIGTQTDDDWSFDVWVDDLMFMGGEPSPGGGGAGGGGSAPTGGGAGGEAPGGGGAGGGP
jgi:hypothetical protein